jgi:hypothetical protein
MCRRCMRAGGMPLEVIQGTFIRLNCLLNTPRPLRSAASYYQATDFARRRLGAPLVKVGEGV